MLQLLRVACKAEEAWVGDLCNTTTPSIQSPSFQNSHAARNWVAERDGTHKLYTCLWLSFLLEINCTDASIRLLQSSMCGRMIMKVKCMPKYTSFIGSHRSEKVYPCIQGTQCSGSWSRRQHSLFPWSQGKVKIAKSLVLLSDGLPRSCC